MPDIDPLEAFFNDPDKVAELDRTVAVEQAARGAITSESFNLTRIPVSIPQVQSSASTGTFSLSQAYENASAGSFRPVAAISNPLQSSRNELQSSAYVQNSNTDIQTNTMPFSNPSSNQIIQSVPRGQQFLNDVSVYPSHSGVPDPKFKIPLGR
jgi:hypothetical protein